MAGKEVNDVKNCRIVTNADEVEELDSVPELAFTNLNKFRAWAKDCYTIESCEVEDAVSVMFHDNSRLVREEHDGIWSWAYREAPTLDENVKYYMVHVLQLDPSENTYDRAVTYDALGIIKASDIPNSKVPYVKKERCWALTKDVPLYKYTDVKMLGPKDIDYGN